MEVSTIHEGFDLLLGSGNNNRFHNVNIAKQMYLPQHLTTSKPAW